MIWLLSYFSLHSIGHPLQEDNLSTGDVAVANSSETLRGPGQGTWIVCNNPPRYDVPIITRRCQAVYDRINSDPKSIATTGWHGVHTPDTITKESDSCVMKLETNHRDQSDVFSLAIMTYVGLRISQRCILGGAASIGTKGFCELPSPDMLVPTIESAMKLVFLPYQQRFIRSQRMSPVIDRTLQEPILISRRPRCQCDRCSHR